MNKLKTLFLTFLAKLKTKGFFHIFGSNFLIKTPINNTTIGKNNEYITSNMLEDMMSPITVEPAINIIRLITGARMAIKV